MFGLEDRHIKFILSILKNNFSGANFDKVLSKNG